MKSKSKPFALYAGFVLAYTLLVILWGAYVRATGSGAGCGSHWPLCDGRVIPRANTVEQAIEFTHRVSSALNGLLVIGLLVWAFRVFPKGHIVRRGATYSMVFIITEGLAGAGLVLFELVGSNTSVARAVAASIHLVNTFLLLAAIGLTAWWSSGGEPVRWRRQGIVGKLLLAGALGIIILGATGAITALGDTLFPTKTLTQGIAQGFSASAQHFLVRLRVWHPLIAVALGVYFWQAGQYIAQKRPSTHTKRFASFLTILFGVQIFAGVVNILLKVPIWMQMLHLLLADLLWLSFLLLVAAATAVSVSDTHTDETVTAVPQAGD